MRLLDSGSLLIAVLCFGVVRGQPVASYNAYCGGPEVDIPKRSSYVCFVSHDGGIVDAAQVSSSTRVYPNDDTCKFLFEQVEYLQDHTSILNDTYFPLGSSFGTTAFAVAFDQPGTSLNFVTNTFEVIVRPSAQKVDEGCVDYLIVPPGTADVKRDKYSVKCPRDGPIVIPAYNPRGDGLEYTL